MVTDNDIKELKEHLNQRISDAHSKINLYTSIIGSLTGIVLILIPLYTFFNLSKESERLAELQADLERRISDRLAIIEEPAEIKINPIYEGAYSESTIGLGLVEPHQCDSGKRSYSARFELHNIGSGVVERVTIKLRGSEGLLALPSYGDTDLPTYLHSHNEQVLAGKVRLNYFKPFCGPEDIAEDARLMIEVYYGNGQVSQTPQLRLAVE
ncbi:MAG: hypothetical protein AAGC79_00720 [Pseudomonadota bacterium]